MMGGTVKGSKAGNMSQYRSQNCYFFLSFIIIYNQRQMNIFLIKLGGFIEAVETLKLKSYKK